MIFMIFFDNKGMNIIYLDVVKILYMYLRRICEIFKFFFLTNDNFNETNHNFSKLV